MVVVVVLEVFWGVQEPQTRGGPHAASLANRPFHRTPGMRGWPTAVNTQITLFFTWHGFRTCRLPGASGPKQNRSLGVFRTRGMAHRVQMVLKA